ncbi:hypothetical protein Tsubulata_048731 [Turnera subulata]|uniref:Bromodomain associated domain-containing protein n=1 Tax=Turnera subulata TaxID=218843 RepID=A0A9Q0GI49_9ROSI|nr:hypothetical protein Tsubulata_048731 [Turnera subulata]
MIDQNTMKPKPRRKKQKPTHHPPTADPPSSPSDFGFAITKTAVSQICRSVGFKSSEISALETLTRVATLYLQTLAKTAASYSNACGRTQSNLFDLINSLHDLLSSSSQGFPGASTLHSNGAATCLLSSAALNGLAGFVNSTDEIPFAKSIPRRNRPPPPPAPPPPIGLIEARGGHIPRWLPGFPDEGAYRECDVECGNKRRPVGDLKLWEEEDLIPSYGGDGMVKEDKHGGGGGELAVDRGKVRFKIRGM